MKKTLNFTINKPENLFKIFGQIFLFSLIVTIGIFPGLMSSADIYEKSPSEVKIIANYNQKIISDYDKLNSTFLIISSAQKLERPGIYSKCSISSQKVFEKQNGNIFLYGIYLKFNDENCLNNEIFVKNGDVVFTDTSYGLNIYNYSTNFNYFTDYSNSQIEEELKNIDLNSYKLDNIIFELKKSDKLADKIELIKNTYLQTQGEYYSVFLNNLLNSRINLEFITPVKGKVLPVKKNIIPNAGRPYRVKYTDGVHHGYDIFAPFGNPTQALADGVIIRIVDNFTWSDFDKILWKDLSYFDKLKNLDIYRGNQVWLKTADGNVTFYSHLDKVNPELKTGEFVKAGTYFGTIGRSGVPDKEYKDFHLHFEIQVNPHNKLNVSYDDIMAWDYFGKKKDYNTIITMQTKLFGSYNIASK